MPIHISVPSEPSQSPKALTSDAPLRNPPRCEIHPADTPQQTDDLEQKKLVYLYLMNYAKTQPELVILAVNTFVKVSEKCAASSGGKGRYHRFFSAGITTTSM
jgi:hypothetical protein